MRLRQAMLRQMAGAVCAVAAAGLLMGAANGAWLERVSAKDHARVNPMVRTAEAQQRAAAAGCAVVLQRVREVPRQ